MKHWKRRKKKYALDPILRGEQLRSLFPLFIIYVIPTP
jgi:hypothetical protein